MALLRKDCGKAHMACSGLALILATSLAIAVFQGDVMAADAKVKNLQQSFTSPREAAAALVAAARNDDAKGLSAILGPAGKQIVFSGDAVADKNGRLRFVELYDEGSRIVEESAVKALLEVGKDSWPFPIPIVATDNGWTFDTKEGKTEILNRRIGRNELGAIRTCLAYADAQREYASKDRNGDGLLEYAQKFASEPGKKDGLYWEAKEDEEQSPMGPFVASARSEGYTNKKSKYRRSPYHGYYYKIMKTQGKHAQGGECDYVIKGRMIGGFALVAYPAKYGSSGIMTFVVNHGGEVYEKDMGRKTSSVAHTMGTFDPDESWRKVKPEYLDPTDEGGGA